MHAVFKHTVYCNWQHGPGNNQVRNYVGNKAKGRILKRVFQEKKDVKFSEKRTFLTP